MTDSILDLMAEALRECRDAEKARRASLTPGAPATTYTEARLARVEAAILHYESRTQTVEPVVGINAWIDQQVAVYTQHVRRPYEKDLTPILSPEKAAEIARGAALFVIADREALIANLRKIGYTVQAPGEENFR